MKSWFFPGATASQQPLETAVIDVNKVTREGVIGRGGMATVYKGKYQGDNVAIKECAMASHRHRETINNLMESEAKIHLSLSHRNIVRMYGFYYDGTTLNIVAELMDTTVEALIYGNSSTLTHEKKLFVSKEFTW